MSDKTARVHTQTSNRQKPRTGKEKKDNNKAVFKSALENPFRVQWPSIPMNLQNLSLSHVPQLLDGYAKHRKMSKKRKRDEAPSSSSKSKSKKRKLDAGLAAIEEDIVPTASTSNAPGPASVPARDDKMDIDSEANDAWSHIVFGINAVTKVLETQVHRARMPLLFSTSTSKHSTALPKTNTPSSIALQMPSEEKTLEYIFVCRADVDPPLLIDHIPPLVAAYNAMMLGAVEKTDNRKLIRLVVLPKGAEDALAQVLGIKRVTVLGFDDGYPQREGLASLLEPVPIISAPWFSKPFTPLVPTHVKHVRTSAPVDMKAKKDLRMKGKAEAKQRQQEKQAAAKERKVAEGNNSNGPRPSVSGTKGKAGKGAVIRPKERPS